MEKILGAAKVQAGGIVVKYGLDAVDELFLARQTVNTLCLEPVEIYGLDALIDDGRNRAFVADQELLKGHAEDGPDTGEIGHLVLVGVMLANVCWSRGRPTLDGGGQRCDGRLDHRTEAVRLLAWGLRK